MLLTFDAGGFCLFISGRTFLESEGNVEVAPEAVRNRHRSGQSDRVLDHGFITDRVRILEGEFFDDMNRIAVNRTAGIPPAGSLTGRIDHQSVAFPVANRIALIQPDVGGSMLAIVEVDDSR